MANNKSFYKSALLTFGIVLLGASCGGGGGAQDRGVYRSPDQGETWVSTSAILTTTAQQGSLAAEVDILKLVPDPQDPLIMYAATRAHGIWFTYDGGKSWNRPRDVEFHTARVNDISINPNSTCQLYAAVQNTVQKSDTCGRTWNGVYKKEGGSNSKSETITSVVINPGRSNEIVLGTSSGAVLRSIDSGSSWASLNRFDDSIKQVMINPSIKDTFYAATAEEGFFRSTDAGATWINVSPDDRDFRGADEYSYGVFDTTKANTLVIATKYGLFRSEDGGDSWSPMPLVTAPGEALIFSLAISPTNPNHIYYGTLNAFYRSLNGGKTWETKRIPTNNAVTALLVDKQDPNVVYLGATSLAR